MGKRTGGGRKAGGGGGQDGHRESSRRDGRSTRERSVAARVRKQKREEELKRHRQLKEMKAVVVLRRLQPEEMEALLGKRKKADIRPLSALQFLPTEILIMILDNIKNPAGLQNCSRANPRLSNVLTPRKPIYLFEQVLPLLLEHLPFNDVKTCRLVCQEWKRGVNQVIDNRPSVDPYDDQIFLKQMGNIRTRLNCGLTAHSQ